MLIHPRNILKYLLKCASDKTLFMLENRWPFYAILHNTCKHLSKQTDISIYNRSLSCSFGGLMKRISVCGNNLVKWKIGCLIEFNFTKNHLLLYQELVRCGHSLKAVVDTHGKDLNLKELQKLCRT